jgi:hypothetical protein
MRISQSARRFVIALPVFALLLLVLPAALSVPSAAQIGVSVRIGPPALPVYEQPICPGDGYLWSPGYWAWSDDDGYYWVPGTWVEAPEPGLLWTPGYWGWNEGAYLWNAGYWGPQIGFYGGINYGYGYGGNGFYGGEWRGGHFFYNTAVMRVNTTQITNVYVNRTVIVNNNSHVAFNGGQGGVAARPTAEQERFAHEQHTPAVASQREQEHAASQNRALFASTNHGRPAVAATARPGEFSGKGVVAARAAGGTYHAPAMSPKEARGAAPAGNRPAESHSAARTAPEKGRPAETHAATAKGSPREAPKETSKEAKPASEPKASHPKETAARPATTHAEKPSAAPASHAEKAPHTSSARPASEPKAESKPAPAPKAHESTPKAAHESAPKPHESTQKASAPKPHESTPKTESAPKAHESAPKASAPRESNAAAPKPEKQAAPARKEAAPEKPEHKG